MMLPIDASLENAKLALGEKYYPDEIWKFAAMAKRFPTIDLDSLRSKGRWEDHIDYDEVIGELVFPRCSLCHKDAYMVTDFCPHCGADMRDE